MQFDHTIPATTQISLQFDGRIPHHLWDAARRIDRERVAKLNRERVRVRAGAITYKPAIIIGLMAAVIAEAAVKRHCVTSDDFARLGLTTAQIEHYRTDAFAKAASENPWLTELEGDAA